MNKEFYFYNSQISQYGVENGYVDLEAFASNFPHIPLCDKMFNNVEYELINGSNVFYCDSAGKEYTFEEREDKVSVYIGNGVAIPHGVGGSEKYIKKSGLSFLQIPEGIDFGDGKIAYLVIGIAGVDGEHLDILANIAVTCSDVEKVEQLKKATTKESVLSILDM